MTEIRIPRINQSATEAVLIEWLVEDGEEVKPGQPIALIETDKSEIEVESPTAGTLQPIATPGQTYEIGQAIAHIRDTEGEPPPRSGSYASPKARRQAKERGIDLNTITGSGRDGLITSADLGTSAPTHRLSPARQRVAKATSHAWQTTPHFVQMIDVDVTELAARRKAWKGVTWTTLFVAALARALRQAPELNVALEGDELLVFDDVNIGVAIDTDHGLLVPVIANADARSLRDLAKAIGIATTTHKGDPAKARATVSNLGAYGVRAGTPVLNSPEPVLLFAGAVEDRAVVVDKQIAVRTMVTLSLAFDHRVVDGAPAASFSASIKAILEHPGNHL